MESRPLPLVIIKTVNLGDADFAVEDLHFFRFARLCVICPDGTGLGPIDDLDDLISVRDAANCAFVIKPPSILVPLQYAVNVFNAKEFAAVGLDDLITLGAGYGGGFLFGWIVVPKTFPEFVGASRVNCFASRSQVGFHILGNGIL